MPASTWRDRGVILRFVREGALLSLTAAELAKIFVHAPLVQSLFFGGLGNPCSVEVPRFKAFSLRAFKAFHTMVAREFDEEALAASGWPLERLEEIVALLEALAAFDSAQMALCKKRIRSLTLRAPRAPAEDLGGLFVWHVANAPAECPAPAGFEPRAVAAHRAYFVRPHAPRCEEEDSRNAFYWATFKRKCLLDSFVRRTKQSLGCAGALDVYDKLFFFRGRSPGVLVRTVSQDDAVLLELQRLAGLGFELHVVRKVRQEDGGLVMTYLLRRRRLKELRVGHVLTEEALRQLEHAAKS